jgi:hypothetical protein
MRALKVVVERHVDGYVAYPLGVEGAVIGEGDTFHETVDDLSSVLQFHVDTSGGEVIAQEQPLEVLVAEVQVRAGAEVRG